MDDSIRASPAAPSDRSPSPDSSIPHDMSESQQKPFRLLDLPLELRMLIYEFALGRRILKFSDSGIWWGKQFRLTARPRLCSARKAMRERIHCPRVREEYLPNFKLLESCRQIYYEASPVHTSSNVFLFDDPALFLTICVRHMPWTQASSLRFLTLRMPVHYIPSRFRGWEYEKYDMLFHDQSPWHHQFWGRTMNGLKRVHIVEYLTPTSLEISDDHAAYCWAYDRDEDPPKDKAYICAQKVRKVPASLRYLAAFNPGVKFSVSVDDFGMRRAYTFGAWLKNWPKENRVNEYREGLQVQADLGDEDMLRRLKQQWCLKSDGKHGITTCQDCARSAMMIQEFNLRPTDKRIFVREYLRRLNEFRTRGPESQELVPWPDSDEIDELVDGVEEYENDNENKDKKDKAMEEGDSGSPEL
ncbi:hypothetical protein HDK90DRAFT_545269 [Phyllosticta capitalensis]|uniref:DUF7730 domain-containing protein n=1 Tax=Phyllosticta capitalensis TaxID=121624 RepID=A0ABR1Y9A4_9PEZI